MEKELSYLSDKISNLESSIDLSRHASYCGKSTGDNIDEMEEEKLLLENILNKLTEIELM